MRVTPIRPLLTKIEEKLCDLIVALPCTVFTLILIFLTFFETTQLQVVIYNADQDTSASCSPQRQILDM